MSSPVLKTLPELTAASAPSATDILPIYQGASPMKKITWTQVLDGVSAATSIFKWIPVTLRAAIIARTSTTDVSSYIQAAVDEVEALGGGEIWFPAGTYTCNTQVNVKSGVVLRGPEIPGQFSNGLGTLIRSTSVVTTMFSVATSVVGAAFIGLSFRGQGNSTAAERLVYIDGTCCMMRCCSLRLCNDAGLELGPNSLYTKVIDVYGSSLGSNYARVARSGGLIVDGTDNCITRSTFGCGQNSGSGSPGQQSITSVNLYNAGVYVKGANAWFTDTAGENCDVSFYLETTAIINRFENCRADQAWGNGIINAGSTNMFSNLFIENVSLNGTGQYSGVKTTGPNNKYANAQGRAVARFPTSAPTLCTPTYAFEDTASNSQVELRNTYYNCAGPYGTALYSFVAFAGATAVEAPISFRQDTATLNANGTTSIVLIHAAPTTVTVVSGGYDGKTVTLIALNGNVTLENNSTIKTNTGANLTLTANRAYRLSNYNGVWYMDA